VAGVTYVTAEVLERRLSSLEIAVKEGQNNIVKFTRVASKAAADSSKALTLAQRLAPLLRVLGALLNIVAIVEQLATIETFARRTQALEDRLDSADKALSKGITEQGRLKQKIEKLEKKLKTYNDILYTANGNASKAVVGLNSLEQKLKTYNDILYTANGNASKAVIGLSNLEKKVSNHNDLIYQANGNASKAVIGLSNLEKKVSNHNDLIYQANGNASKAVIGLNSIEKRLKGFNDLLYQANSNATKALQQKATPGKNGLDGKPGVPGPAGKNGLDGKPGVPGPAGKNGLDGKPGVPGPAGKNGLDGKPGVPGPAGKNGLDGKPGVPGPAGKNGLDGKPGVPGKDGKDGKDVNPADVEAIKRGLAEINNKVVPIALFTVAVNGLNRNISNLPGSEPFKAGVAEGTCRTTQPGGCMGKKFDGLQNSANQSNSKLDKLNAALQGADLALLGTINTKLGAQVPGGISGKLGTVFKGVQKLGDILQVNKILNVLGWIGILHNALMLSNSIKTTLFSLVDVWMDAIGFKVTKINEEGEKEDVDAGEIVGQWTLAFANSVFGAQNVAELTLAYKKANRIYQAATNMLDAVQGMFDSARQIAEYTAGSVGKIGNALVNAGTVFEDAYSRMQERVTARSTRQAKFDSFIQTGQRTQDMLETIESIGSEVVNFQDGAKELVEARTEFEKAKTEGEKFLKDQSEAEKLASKSPEIGDLSFDLARQTEED
jgi:hypothetical protein